MSLIILMTIITHVHSQLLYVEVQRPEWGTAITELSGAQRLVKTALSTLQPIIWGFLAELKLTYTRLCILVYKQPFILTGHVDVQIAYDKDVYTADVKLAKRNGLNQILTISSILKERRRALNRKTILFIYSSYVF